MADDKNTLPSDAENSALKPKRPPDERKVEQDQDPAHHSTEPDDKAEARPNTSAAKPR